MHEFNYRRQYDYEIGEYDLMEKTFTEIARSQTRPFWEGVSTILLFCSYKMGRCLLKTSVTI